MDLTSELKRYIMDAGGLGTFEFSGKRFIRTRREHLGKILDGDALIIGTDNRMESYFPQVRSVGTYGEGDSERVFLADERYSIGISPKENRIVFNKRPAAENSSKKFTIKPNQNGIFPVVYRFSRN